MSLLDEVRIVEAYERMLIREELDEIFKLKPEAGKKAAKKKMKQISDEIKRAIEKHGEDSKVVQYLRSKKKNMHQQLAHAMGESEEETCPEGQKWDAVQEKCIEPGKELEMADEALAIPKGATVETIANFLQKEFNISKAKAMKQAKEYKEKGKEKGFHRFEGEELSEGQFKKKYGGKNLKYRFHYGMDLSELINLVKHITFEKITKPNNMGPADPNNRTQFDFVYTGVIQEVENQFRIRAGVAMKEIKQVLPEIVKDALTLPEVK
jgi:hypothetical protein